MISLLSRLPQFIRGFVQLAVLPISISTSLNLDVTLEFPIFIRGIGASTTHLVPLRLGEPPQTIYVLPDTGSRATWVYCHPCPYHRGDISSTITRSVFGCTQSTAFFPIRCSSPHGLCRYTHEYADGTSASGHWATETLTVKTNRGMKIKLRDVKIGCTSKRFSNVDGVDGILGLSPAHPSLAKTLAKELGGVFSYHISTAGRSRNHGGHRDLLIFGITTRSLFRHHRMQYIKLHLDHDRRFFYVKITGVSIDGVQLDTPTADTWAFDERTGAGGVVVDTGTTFTYLPEAAYQEIFDTYFDHLMKYESLEIADTDDNICFDWRDATFEWSRLPKLTIVFEGGARLTPHAESLFYEDEEEEGMRCLGVMKGGEDGLTIGSLFQRDFFWEYDLNLQTLGFASVDVEA